MMIGNTFLSAALYRFVEDPEKWEYTYFELIINMAMFGIYYSIFTPIL